MRLVVIVACAVLVVSFQNFANAQNPIRDLFESIDKNRPRLFDKDREKEKQTQQQNQSQSQRQQQAFQQRQGQSSSDRSNYQRNQAGANNQGFGQPTPAQYPRQQAQNQAPQNSNYHVPSPTQSQRSTELSPNPNLQAGNQTSSRNSLASATTTKPNIGAQFSSAKSGKGLVIDRLNSQSPLAKAGLKQGDIIVTFGGLEISDQEEFNDILNVIGHGDQIELGYLRKGKQDSVFVQFGEVADDGQQSSALSSDSGPSGQSPSAYDPILPPASANSRNAQPSSVLGDFSDFAPPSNSTSNQNVTNNTVHGNAANIDQLQRQMQEMQRVIDNQQRTIQQLQNQLRGRR
ncbi:MAG TPA: PDZ domain-containing protein [Pirellulaceae bacterium]|nr:PDZ domain-containing protein [Pirellulaceae bacterium]HMO90985.1 PDZ domain-containing protein [Pirellulaceae bacterium]HMP68100.1 PDZ domain-containing protein [Pirellulaceae bacterium]